MHQGCVEAAHELSMSQRKSKMSPCKMQQFSKEDQIDRNESKRGQNKNNCNIIPH